LSIIEASTPVALKGRTAVKRGKPELLHGTLELLILKTLAVEPMHGWGISKHIQQISEEVLEIGQGSLYPALYRLEDREWVRAKWGVASTGRRAKVYSLTKRGRKQLATEEAQWEAFSVAVNRVLGSA
jgi:PadR family transcriptional regulator PadR